MVIAVDVFIAMVVIAVVVVVIALDVQKDKELTNTISQPDNQLPI